MNEICQHCNALHWKELLSAASEKNKYWNSCCIAGKVRLDNLKTPPPFLKDLYDDLSEYSKQFKENIRRYNAAFAFTSVKCTAFNQGVSNMPVQIQGQLYHLQGPLCADDELSSVYAQLYILDPQYAASVRFAYNNKKLDKDLIEIISLLIHDINPYVNLYKHVKELLDSNAARSDMSSYVRIAPSARIELIAGNDRRTENLPTNNEVAVVVPNETSAATFRDIRVYLRNSDSAHPYTTISQTHGLYMPLHYTILFPHGDIGWNWGMRLANGDKLTQRAYYRYTFNTD